MQPETSFRPAEYAAASAAWELWQREYRYGALYVFPPPGVIELVDELRRWHDPKSHAICQAHISLSRPLQGPLTVAQFRELEAVLRAIEPFSMRYGPLRSFPPHPGVVFEIHPEAEFTSLQRAVHSTSAFAGLDLGPETIPPHMTIAEFISLERTNELLLELRDNVAFGEFLCETVQYAVPDANFRFQPHVRIPLRRHRGGSPAD